MKLLAKKIRRRLPLIADTGPFTGWVALVKLFTPDSDWTWYAAQFHSDDLFFDSWTGGRWRWAVSACRKWSRYGDLPLSLKAS